MVTVSPSRGPFRLARVSRLAYETSEDGTVAVVSLRGELDLGAVPSLEPELERLAGEPGLETVALDLRGLEFMDSSGLRLVVLTEQRLRGAGRRLALVRGPQSVHRVFEITRMAERLDFVDEPEQVRA
jgi:anti-anti-sigma factor